MIAKKVVPKFSHAFRGNLYLEEIEKRGQQIKKSSEKANINSEWGISYKTIGLVSLMLKM